MMEQSNLIFSIGFQMLKNLVLSGGSKHVRIVIQSH